MTDREVEGLPTLEQVEARVAAEAVSRDPESHAMVEAALNLFSKALGKLAGLKPSNEWELVAYGMAAGDFYSLVAAYRLLPRGYYRQAAALARMALEDLASCSYVCKYPEKAKLWLQPNWNLIPKFAEMRKHVEPELSARWQEAYGILSEFVHPRRRALDQIFGQARRRALEPCFDGKHLFALSHVIVETVLSTLAVVPFLNGAVSSSDSLTREFSELQERFKTWSNSRT
ncbi:MAG: hypothetical protein ACUVV3_07560 [Dehalococcoidia bacterium]